MKIKLLFLGIICTVSIRAQELQFGLPIQYDDSVLNKNKKYDVEFYTYNYISNKIDVRDFKRRYPTFKVPDFIEIDLPLMENHKDTVVLLAAIDKKENENDLIIWLAGDYNSNNVTFYIDRTLDRNFNNDGKPLVINSRDKPIKVVYKPLQKKNRKEVYLAVKHKDGEDYESKLLSRKWKESIANQFSLEILAGIGVGKIAYDYLHTGTGFPAWYDVNLSVKNLGLSASYDFDNLRIGLGMNYFNMFYYTSYTRVRFDVPIIQFTSQGPRDIENVQIDRNLDVHSEDVFQFYAQVGYKFKMGKFSNLIPYAQYGLTNFGLGEYIPNRTEPENAYPLNGNTFTEFGLRAEFTVGKKRAVFLGVAFNNVNWNPEGFIESLPQEDFDSSFRTTRGVFGYRLGF